MNIQPTKNRIALLALLFFSTLFCQAQTADSNTCPCIKPIFNYLLQSGRLNITKQENITVQSLVADANDAGYPVGNCSSLLNDPNAIFYTLTPQYIISAGILHAPKDSAYRAMLGNYQLTFRSVAGAFERKSNSFFSTGCSSSKTILYAATPLPVTCTNFYIDHLASDLPNWYVSYIDCGGKKQRLVLPTSESSARVCGTSIQLVQDVDIQNHIYASSFHIITLADSTVCSFDSANYWRETIAELQVDEIESSNTQKSEEQISVRTFPNPTANNFLMEVKNISKTDFTITVVDMYGKIVEQKRVNAGTNTIRLGGNYKAGIYYADIFTNDKRIATKLIKLRNN